MVNSNSNCSIAPTIEDKDIYKFALDTRNFEIAMFWQRSNYFLALNSALAVGFFNLNGTAYPALLAALGFVAALLWYRVNLGSKFWQSRWEYRLYEVEHKIAPMLGFFSATRHVVQEDVQESLTFNRHNALQRWFDREMLRKPSVSFSMTLLSVAFILAWVAAIVLSILRVH